MRVLLSPQARQDLEEIVEYILQERPEMAQVVLDRINEGICSLTGMPHMGRPGRVPGTRELVVPRTPFIVPYQVTGKTVEILRVYHGARRWPEQL